jgi:CRISPR type I-E-associated protein CasA/Cse1
MNDSAPSYNLIGERWIPVLWSDGRPNRVGVREALTQAGRIRQIAASNPMDRVAIIRFLLALLYWRRGNPPLDESEIPNESFPPDWFSKLDDHRECFNLLGGNDRFYQYRGSSAAKDEKKTANYLIQEIPTGTNHWHFRHSTDGVRGLCPACCALGLLRLPVFATSGGRGMPPGVNSKPPLYVIPLGATLAETLLLSWRPVQDLGIPAWVKPGVALPRAGKVPLLVGMSWLPRRVWLDDPAQSAAHCISCGREDRLILSCVFAPIGSARPNEGAREWSDLILPRFSGHIDG